MLCSEIKSFQQAVLSILFRGPSDSCKIVVGMEGIGSGKISTFNPYVRGSI